jgi:hypothetical protein
MVAMIAIVASQWQCLSDNQARKTPLHQEMAFNLIRSIDE